MAFQVVITEHPGNIHGRYQVGVRYDAPIPTPDSLYRLSNMSKITRQRVTDTLGPDEGRTGHAFGTDDLDLAKHLARLMQGQGVAAEVAVELKVVTP